MEYNIIAIKSIYYNNKIIIIGIIIKYNKKVLISIIMILAF